MEFKIITVDEFNKDHGAEWDPPMSEYRGEVLGFCLGVTPEVKLKDGTLDSESTTFIPSIEELNNSFWTWHRADVSDRYEWTGRLIFRGYYTEYYDYEEHEDYYVEEDIDDVL